MSKNNTDYVSHENLAPNAGKHWTHKELAIIRYEITHGNVNWMTDCAARLGRSKGAVRAALFEYHADLRDTVIQMSNGTTPHVPAHHDRTPIDKVDLRLFHIERKLDVILRELGVGDHD